MKSTKTIPLEIMDTDPDSVEAIKKCANLINYDVSGVILDNGRIIPARKLRPMVYAHLRGNIDLKSQVRCNISRKVAGTYKTIVDLQK
jgi:hypothetical protein